MDGFKPHSSHWGAFYGRHQGEALEIRPHPADPHPSPLLGNLPAIAHSPARIRRPAVRRGWLEGGADNAGKRGSDGYVEVSWPEALDLVAHELRRVHAEAGPRAIFGGSYGWSSAGRFHHTQSQIHRFLNVLGGYVRSVNTYSSGAAMVIIPHVIDLLDPSDLRGKPIVLTATGGGDRHSLVVEHQLRPLFAFFEAFVTPTAIYASGRDFTDGAPSPAILGRVNQALGEAAMLINARSISAAIAAE